MDNNIINQQQDKNSKRILGIDPGTTIMGYGIITIHHDSPEIVVYGIVELSKYKDHFTKLEKIFSRTLQLIDEYEPADVSIESPFYGKNVQSMLKLGRAQGVAISAAVLRTVPIFEYAPRKIKQSITGEGNASKQQVAACLTGIFGLKEQITNYDAADGLATALCHYYQQSFKPYKSKSYKDWGDFIKKNPGSIK